MRIQISHVVAVLSVLGLVSWVSLRGRGSSRTVEPHEPEPVAPRGIARVDTDRTEGSSVACAVPLAWRVARVDRGFGLDTARARAAVERAARLWETAVGRRLFSISADGEPVRFVYDERQARTAERLRLQRTMDEDEHGLAARGAELDQRSDLLQRTRREHAERARDLARRLSTHNATAQEWNLRGGAPDNVRAELTAAVELLQTESVRIEEEQAHLDAMVDTLREARRLLSQEIAAHNRRREELERAFAPAPVESGLYTEALHTQGNRVVAIDREIQVFRFGDLDELHVIIAHELGHALGLGHAAEAGHLMSAEQPGTGRDSGVQPGDLAALRALCPDL